MFARSTHRTFGHFFTKMENEEIWKDIPGYEGLYMVSNHGRVKCLERTVNCGLGARVVPEKIKVNSVDSQGYEYVWLWNKTGRTQRVHRLVCLAFIPNSDDKPCIDHINGNRRDNRVENLRWCTHRENSNFDIAHERMSKNAPWRGKYGSSVPWSRGVIQYGLDGRLICDYDAIITASRVTGVKHGLISACCRGAQKTAGGYIWKYKNI